MLKAEGARPPASRATGAASEKIAVEARDLEVAECIAKDVDARYLDLLPVVTAEGRRRQAS